MLPEETDEELPSFLEAVRARLIHLPSMDRALRLVTGVALAQLAACAILLAGARLPLPTIPIAILGGAPVSIPAWIFGFSVALLAVAWTYLLGGALHAHPVVRLIAIGFFLVERLATGVIFAAYPLPARAGLTAILVVIAAIALFTFQRDRLHARCSPERTYAHRLRAPTFAALASLVGLSYLLPGVIAAAGGAAHEFVISTALEFSVLSLLVTVVLVLAGIDFADMGESTGERLGALARRLVGARGLAAVLAVEALAILATAVHRGGWRLPAELVAAALLAAAVFAVSRLARVDGRWPSRIPYLGLVATSAVIFVAELVFIVVLLVQHAGAQAPVSSAAVPSRVFVQPQAPVFSLRIPLSWQATSVRDDAAGIAVTSFSAAGTGDPGLFYVISLPPSAAGGSQQALDSWLRVCCPHETGRVAPEGHATQGGWDLGRLSLDLHNGGPQLPGRSWFKTAAGVSWLLYGLTPDYAQSLDEPEFQLMVDTWAPSTSPGSAPAPTPAAAGSVPDSTRIAAYLSLTWLGVAGLGLGLLVARRRRPRSRSGAAALLLFLVVGGLMFFAESLNKIGALFGLPEDETPHLAISGTQAAVAIASLGVVAWFGLRRRLGAAWRWLLLLVTLNTGLQVVAWMIDLYSVTQAVTLGLAQGVLLLVAISWDVSMSGSSTTNVHGRWFPRHARVLLFFGYEVLTATCIVFYSSFRVPAGGEPPSLFISDVWPQIGLILLGLPLLVSVFVLRASSRRATSE